MTASLDHRPPEITDLDRAAALNFMSRGGTAAGVREHAADAFYVMWFARITGFTEDESRTRLLAIADAIENLGTAHGVTWQAAYFLERLDEEYGPFPGPDSLWVA